MATSNKKEIMLWRNFPPTSKGNSKKFLKNIYPSARQAITQVLVNFGLGRHSRIAIPDWSSHCVISSVGKIAMPLPMSEVVKNKIKVDAVLLYEQWGWPFIDSVPGLIIKNFPHSLIILDRVDSADIFRKNLFGDNLKLKLVEIFSLSKILGLSGGGLIRSNGKWWQFKSEQRNNLDNKIKNLKNKIIFNLYKDNIPVLHHDLRKWLNRNDLFKAILDEASARRNNLIKIFNSQLSRHWPDWMSAAAQRGARPAIAPLFRGKNRAQLLKIKTALRNKFNLESEIYHFNWSGSPLLPKYQICLAFPVNGSLKKINPVIKELAKYG